MKGLGKWIVGLLCALAAGLGGGNALAADPGHLPLRVAFWNIEWFPGKRPSPTPWEEKDHIPLVQREIVTLNPDILGMGEIRDFDAAKLAVAGVRALTVDVCSRFRLQSGDIGTQQLAIAAKAWPVSAWSEAWQPAESTEIPRGFTFAAYAVGKTSVVLFYALHYKSNRGDIQLNIPAREASTRQLLAHVERMEAAYGAVYPNVVVVLGGDFNTTLDPDPRFEHERSLRDLIDAGFTWVWQDVPFHQRVTLPSGPQMDPKREPFPDTCFDHIFVKGAAVRKAWVQKASPLASDHRPVAAEILVPLAAPPTIDAAPDDAAL